MEIEVPRRSRAPFWLLLATMALVVGAAFWSAMVERRAALDDLKREQQLLAQAVGIDLEHQLALRGDLDPSDKTVRELLAGVTRVERPAQLMVLVSRPSREGFLTTDDRTIPSRRLRSAFETGADSIEVPRDEAVSFGLPRRLAVAGLARVVDRQQRTWGIVALTTAERIRDRERHELLRLAITIGLVAVLTALFGLFVQRRQRAEQERERELLLSRADKMASLAAIGTGIAHELGTPLSVIVGRAESALARSTDDRVSKALTVVLEQSARIEAIARGCLALVRGESPPLNPRPASAIAADAVALVAHRFEQRGVRLESRAPADLPSIACEPALFAQVLVNLLLNACHATAPGGLVTLEVRAADGKVRFVVDDEGAGIDAEVAARAAEPFFSTRRDEGGHGLGLSIAREIVSHHQGTLTLARLERGHGTRATVTINAVT